MLVTDRRSVPIKNDSTSISKSITSFSCPGVTPFGNSMESVNCDGVIDSFKQGKTGDCWVLAGLESLANTKDGAAAIKDAVKKNFWGGVTVELKGINKKYSFSASDLKNAKNLSQGDDDVKAIELAIKEYRKDLIEEKMKTLSSDESGFAAIAKKRKARSVNTGSGTNEDPLKGGDSGEFIYLMTGKKANSIKNYGTKPSFKNISEIADPKSSPMTISFKKDLDDNLVSGHAYAVLDTNDKVTTLVNPWDNSKVLKVPNSVILESYDTIQYTDLGDDLILNSKKAVSKTSPQFTL